MANNTWVALGDSYTAGVIKAAGDQIDASDGRARTTQSYPQVAARALGSTVKLVNVSSSSASVANIHDENQFASGLNYPPFSYDDTEYAFLPVQVDALNHDIDVITVGVGIHHIALIQTVAQCMELSTETKGKGAPGRDKLGTEMDERLTNLAQVYDDMLDALYSMAAKATILTVGYPAIFPTDPGVLNHNDPSQLANITPGDVDWLRETLIQVNTLISDVADARGHEYVDLYASSRDHAVGDKDNWVDGLVPGMMLPNAKGHQSAATLVQAAIAKALANN